MRTLKIAVFAVVLAVAFVAGGIVVPAVRAEWTAGENSILFERVARVAEAIHNANLQAQDLASIADSEDITNSPEFVDVPPWVKGEVIDLKQHLFDDLKIFLDGSGPLTAKNRQAYINAVRLGLNP